jgi:parvulin-like peptidyl-prolyl isomerase
MMQEKDEKIELEKLGKSEYFKLFNNGCERIQELTAENIRVKEVYRLETACHEQQIKELQSQLENVSKELVWTKNAAHIHLKNEVMFQEEFEKAKLRIKELEGMTAKQTITTTRKSPKGG